MRVNLLVLLLCVSRIFGQGPSTASKREPIPLPPLDAALAHKPRASQPPTATSAGIAGKPTAPDTTSTSAASPATGSLFPPPPPIPPANRPLTTPTEQRVASVPGVQLGFADERQTGMVDEYLGRVTQMLDDEQELHSLTELPAGYSPWWGRDQFKPLRRGYTPMEVTLESIIVSALSHSPRVQAFRMEPTISQKSVAIESAQFDWLAFAETNWDDLSDPVGNELTTGGSPQFRDNKFSFQSGLRRRTRQGGEWELSETIGWQDNNSRFFVPTPQGTSRFEISFTQPLLRQQGRFYNTSRVVQAKLDTKIADSEALTTIQDHLVEVVSAYWELFRARATYLQKKRLLALATEILARLEGRRGVDVLKRQILRARAAVATRRAEIARAAASVKNAEARLRLLVNDPVLTSGSPIELVPSDVPVSKNLVYPTADTVTVGLMTRPDIATAIRKIRLQSVRLGVTRNEILPQLDLVLNSYVAGLKGDGDILGSARRRLQEGEPGYSIGLNFEIPLGNRAAKANMEQQQFRLKKAMFDFKDTVETSITEIELAVREARTSHTEMLSRYQSMQAAESETKYLGERWKRLPGDDRSTSELLEDLLDAQERLATQESEFEIARRNYMLALTEIKRSTGTLLASGDGQSRMGQRGSLASPQSTRSAPEPVERPTAAPAIEKANVGLSQSSPEPLSLRAGQPARLDARP